MPVECVEHSDNVLASVHVLSNRITRAFESRIEARYGISVAEWRVLLSLFGTSGLTAKEIHEQWAMDKMTVSRAVRRLEEDGWVKRHRHPEDGRSFVLVATPRGVRLVKKILPTADARYREVLSCLTGRERKALERTLVKLLRHTATLK